MGRNRFLKGKENKGKVN